ncbi:hypothetical protein L6164_024366 [Bauhinia variegata]|uniref:Uncharacterized protein n=1 Tax=Bauhinia variegata TaxID=167791 RepID=A0ACB9LYQ5_BAUVA|nr:hypothetical protein L6164_024366 [Bauhinia variegata]
MILRQLMNTPTGLASEFTILVFKFMVLNMHLEHMNMTLQGFLKWNRSTVLALLSENQFSLEQQILARETFGLTGKSIPRWVNRLARLGLFCNCVLPPGLNETKVRQLPLEDKKLRNQSSRYETCRSPPLSSRPSSAAIKNNSRRRCLTPSSSLIHTSSTSTVAVK